MGKCADLSKKHSAERVDVKHLSDDAEVGYERTDGECEVVSHVRLLSAALPPV
jgi:hypothetical protein